VEVPLLDAGNTNITFQVDISSVVPEGASVGDFNSCTVVISNDRKYQNMVEEVMSIMEDNEKYHVGSASWTEQFSSAMNMEVDDECEPGAMDYLMHGLSFYWKVLHAFIPPTCYCGGWATFCTSLLAIGIITCMVGDTAKMFGCCVGLKDSVTAITFVALGTSLPDTFASMEATISDDTADAAITNVTGSNSVNVFLGLGLPWTMAAVYHCANGNSYSYPAGDLVFSVIVFSALAVVCIGMLVFRRSACGGELGGPKMMAYMSSAVLAFFWFTYILLSSLKAYGHI